jgi:hypothetical protein
MILLNATKSVYHNLHSMSIICACGIPERPLPAILKTCRQHSHSPRQDFDLLVRATIRIGNVISAAADAEIEQPD